MRANTDRRFGIIAALAIAAGAAVMVPSLLSLLVTIIGVVGELL